MTENEKILIEELRVNVRRLISKLETSENNLSALKEENEQLKASNDHYSNIYQDLEQRYNNLKIAKSLIGEEQASDDAKKKITRIVREIDKCIALLNK